MFWTEVNSSTVLSDPRFNSLLGDELFDLKADRWPKGEQGYGTPNTAEEKRQRQSARSADLYAERVVDHLRGGARNLKAPPSPPQRKALSADDLRAVRACVHRALARWRQGTMEALDQIKIDSTEMPAKPAPVQPKPWDPDPEAEREAAAELADEIASAEREAAAGSALAGLL